MLGRGGYAAAGRTAVGRQRWGPALGWASSLGPLAPEQSKTRCERKWRAWRRPGQFIESHVVRPEAKQASSESRNSTKQRERSRIQVPRCESHRNCVWLTRLTRASNRFDPLARSIRSNLPQCLTTGAMRRIDLACRLTETVAELASSRFAFKATGPAPQLQLLFSRPPYPHKREADSDLYQRQRLNTEFTGLSRG